MENVFIRFDCSPGEIQLYTDLFKEFRDVFAWSHEEMPGIDPKIDEHGHLFGLAIAQKIL
jgi:hypothetical protein